MDLQNKRFLIVKPSSLGDIVHTLPLAHALKRCYPESWIGWIVQEAYAPLTEGDPAVDAVYRVNIPSTSDPHAGRLAYIRALPALVQTLYRLRRWLRREPYDLVLDLHASFRSGLFGLTNPGGTRIGFADAKELNPLFLHRRIEVPDSVVHAVDKNMLFCDHLRCPPGKSDFQLYSSDRDRSRVAAFLQGHRLCDDDVLVYVNPAARWRTKFWGAGRWAELADRLIGEAGLRVVFAGSAKDRDYIVGVSERMSRTPIVAAGELSLTETVALLQRSAVYAGLDSGPMHMAAMAGVPVVALFGPTNPERVGPYGVEHRLVRNEGLACLGCRKRHCGVPRCMEGIAVDRVYRAVLSLIDCRRSAAGGGKG